MDIFGLLFSPFRTIAAGEEYARMIRDAAREQERFYKRALEARHYDNLQNAAQSDAERLNKPIFDRGLGLGLY